jgi:myo-inositol 2-dehydrogenase/D-chiro-inositol 1-dehydrogenase
MKFAVFGAGRMGERHIANIAKHDRAALAYIVDPDEARASALAARYGGQASTDPARALADRSLEAVIIASAANTHVDLIVAAARAGKAILCEKPIDLDMGRAETCAKAIEGCTGPIMIGFQRRFDPTHRAVKQAVQNGDVGEIECITIVSRDPAPPPSSYIEVSGGQFHDQMIHDFDMALWLSGASGRIELFAMASNLVDPEIGKLGDTDTAEVLLRFETGALCRIHCSRRAIYGYDQRVEVFGSNGMICSGNLPRTGIERYSASTTAARDALLPSFMERYLSTYELELDCFIEAVAHGSSIDADFESGRRALLLADAARRSHPPWSPSCGSTQPLA